MKINTPSGRPVAAGGLAGALATVLVWVLELLEIETPPVVAAAWVTIFSFLVATATHRREVGKS